MAYKYRTACASAASVVLLSLLSACVDVGPTDTPQDFAVEEETSTIDSPVGSNEGYELVGPETLANGAGEFPHFFVDLAGDITECKMEEAQVSCEATPDDSVPNLEEMKKKSHVKGRPGAVILNAEELTWGRSVGSAPARQRLDVGQMVEYGDAWCQVPAETYIDCGVGSEAFRVSAPDLNVSQPS